MFGNSYLPQPTPYMPGAVSSPFSPRNELQFVNDIDSARAYQMLPNSKQILLDKNLPRFYLVETDATGMKSVTPYDFTEAKDDPTPEYLTKEEFNVWRTNYESAIQQQQTKPAPKPTIDESAIPSVNETSNGLHAKHEAHTRWRTGPSQPDVE